MSSTLQLEQQRLQYLIRSRIHLLADFGHAEQWRMPTHVDCTAYSDNQPVMPAFGHPWADLCKMSLPATEVQH